MFFRCDEVFSFVSSFAWGEDERKLLRVECMDDLEGEVEQHCLKED
jgi:hypothetical protein